MLTIVYLFLAVVLEVAGITSMKLADGFNKLEPSIMIFVFYAMSFIFLTLALKRVPVSVAYAIWSGVGTLLIAMIGVQFFHEPMNLIKAMSLGLIVMGVVGLRLG